MSLDTALFTHWQTAGLAATIPGGLHTGRLPAADAAGSPIQLPYCLLTPIASTVAFWTDQHEYQTYLVQFTVFAASKSAAEAFLAAIREAYRLTNLDLPAESGTLLDLRPTTGHGLVERDSSSIWRGTLRFQLTLAHARP